MESRRRRRGEGERRRPNDQRPKRQHRKRPSTNTRRRTASGFRTEGRARQSFTSPARPASPWNRPRRHHIRHPPSAEQPPRRPPLASWESTEVPRWGTYRPCRLYFVLFTSPRVCIPRNLGCPFHRPTVGPRSPPSTALAAPVGSTINNYAHSPHRSPSSLSPLHLILDHVVVPSQPHSCCLSRFPEEALRRQARPLLSTTAAARPPPPAARISGPAITTPQRQVAQRRTPANTAATTPRALRGSHLTPRRPRHTASRKATSPAAASHASPVLCLLPPPAQHARCLQH